MKLYECPNNCFVRILEERVKIPPASISIKDEDILKFLHIDGMYGYCINSKNQVVYPAAWTEVELVA